jgi:DNA-binding response OmpR family regulator
LVIEDDPATRRLVVLQLAALNFEAELVQLGPTCLAAVDSAVYDLVIADLTAPHVDGLDIFRRLRAQPRYTPIIVLTTYLDDLDRVFGLESGADEFVTKPLNMPEFAARVKAVLRRVHHQQANVRPALRNTPADIVTHRELRIDNARREARLGDALVHLTVTEFDLLAHLANNPGRVYSRIQLLEQVWDDHFVGHEHTVNTHINRLRRKLETDANHPQYILTVWGVGYKFAEPASEP